MSTPLRISNRDARWLWLTTQGLATAPTGPLNLRQIIKNLGFVQLDTIRNVTRAHHHILWNRNQNYREPMLKGLLADDRAIFEHFTHDASVIPIEFYPMWQRQFRRLEEKVSQSSFYRSALSRCDMAAIKERIAHEGPLSTHAFDTKITGKKEMWARPPHKKALDHMWYAGELTTSHRENFVKYYDLTERVIPPEHLQTKHSEKEQIDWLCRNALGRLGFGAPGDIQRFWGAMSAVEAKSWVDRNQHQLVSVELQASAGGWVKAYAPADIESRLAATARPTSRLRIINPFDPVIRDRDRLARLFGFDYRIEIFVPAAKRQWGYYVYPLLECDRFVGRIELKADRRAGQLHIVHLWKEPGIQWTAKRAQKLDTELGRIARFVDTPDIRWQCGRSPIE